jgi:hypothetical protein
MVEEECHLWCLAGASALQELGKGHKPWLSMCHAGMQPHINHAFFFSNNAGELRVISLKIKRKTLQNGMVRKNLLTIPFCKRNCG